MFVLVFRIFPLIYFQIKSSKIFQTNKKNLIRTMIELLLIFIGSLYIALRYNNKN